MTLLEFGDEVEILTFGPYTVHAECTEVESIFQSSLTVSITYPDSCEDDLVIFGEMSNNYRNGTFADIDSGDTDVESGFVVKPGTTDASVGEIWWHDEESSDEGIQTGNDSDEGALMSSSGYYISVSGDLTIGMSSKENFSLTNLPFGGKADCTIAGKLHLMQFS